MYDIAIIGTGPSGSTLARLVAGRFSVAILDKRSFRRAAGTSNEKCCGGLLAPDAQAALAQLGLGLPRDVLAGPQLFTVKSLDMASGLSRHYQRHYINIDRGRFDQWLWSLIPDNVRRFTESHVTSIIKNNSRFTIEFRHAGVRHEISAGTIIGADGAMSIVRRLLYPGKKPGRIYYAMQEWFRMPECQPYYSAIFDPEITDYYAWMIPKDDFMILGAALDAKDRPMEKFNLLKKKLAVHGMVFRDPFRRKATFLQRPRGPGDVFFGRGNALLIGEAAGFASPSSGEGLSYALKSAMHLAGRLYGGCGLSGWTGMKRIIAGKSLKAAIIFNPVIRRLIMRMGIGSMNSPLDLPALPLAQKTTMV